MPSTNIQDLVPAMQPLANNFLQKAKEAGFNLRITCTYRSNEEQAELYAQGRTKPGAIVTNAKPGQSLHNQRRALDIVDRIKGYDMDWEKLGKIGESCGLEWGGRWDGFKDKPHFQYTGPETIQNNQTKENTMSQIVPASFVKEIYKTVRGSYPDSSWPDYAPATSDRPLEFVLDMLVEAHNRGVDEGKKQLQGALEQAANEISKKNDQVTQLQNQLAAQPAGDYVPVGELFIKK